MTTTYSNSKTVQTPFGEAQLVAGTAFDTTLKTLLAPYRKEKGMSWANPPGTIWIEATVKGNAAGICAIARIQNHHVRFKSDVVLPLFRRQGIYSALSAFRLEIAQSMEGVNLCTAYAGPDSIGQFLKDGFVVVGPREEKGTNYVTKVLTK